MLAAQCPSLISSQSSENQQLFIILLSVLFLLFSDATGLRMSNSTASSYKQLKEDFVSNLTGGPVSEIAAVTAVLPVSQVAFL